MNKIKSNDIVGLTAKETLTLFIQIAVQYQFSYAVWKCPNDDIIHFLADCSGKEKILKPDLNNLPPGFLVSPFYNKTNDKTSFIQADLYYQIKNDNISSCLLSEDKNLQVEKFETAVVKLLEKGIKTRKNYSSNNKVNSTEKESFESLVATAIEKIKADKFEKLVPSRVKLIDLPPEFEVINCFYQLCVSYPNAMVSLVGTPSLGTWVGASPELLVSMNKEGVFKTVSLAGTQKLPSGFLTSQDFVSQTSWTQKEIEEQALVSRYIINCFKKIRLREYEERGPKTVLAGNLMHLKTDYSVDTKSVGFPELPSVMLELLHPTSAVSGMPREDSFEFIQKNEGFDRQLFSGYLGPVNIAEATNIFVNIRCMQILDQQAALYAGAGVTADSNPEKEWLETELKCETLLNIIRKKV